METLRFLMISTHFPPHHLGGDAVFVEYLSKELANRGHEVHVFYNPAVYELIRNPGHSRESEPARDTVHRHLYRPWEGRVETLTALTLGLCGRATQAAADLFKAIRPDVVHWHNSRGFIGRPIRFENEISLYTSHDYGAICPRSNLLKPNLEVCERARMCTLCNMRWRKPPQLWRILSKRVLTYPDNMKIIAPSEFVGKRLAEDGVRVSYILRNFVPDPNSRCSHEKTTPEEIVYLGMLEIHKGLRTLIRAFDKSTEDQGFVLNVIGDGSLRHELSRMTSTSRLKERIRLHGFLERGDAERLRKRAVAQAVPSEWYENCPLTILEALASGIPVIGSDIGGIPEILGPESGSRLFTYGDANALADVLVGLWAERENLDSLRKKARATYESRFGPDSHITEYMKIINDSG